MTSTKKEYKVGKDSRASTFAQNIVRGGRAPSLTKAKKEEIRLKPNQEIPRRASR